MAGTVGFRCDASASMGGGHIMRCLTLAGALARKGWNCAFLTNPEAIHLLPALKDSGFPVYDAGQPPPRSFDWLIVDHYGLGAAYEQVARNWARHILAVDDLADRAHDADILVDQTYGRGAADYAAKVPPGCRILAGSAYAMLRPQFTLQRERSLSRRRERGGRIESILVFVSSADPVNLSVLIAEALDRLSSKLVVTFVLSPQAPGFASVSRSAERSHHDIKIIPHAEDMAALMAAADLAVGAGGTSSWERCCLGLPALLIEIANNQKDIAAALHQAGAVLNLGWHEQATPVMMASALDNLLSDPARVRDMGEKAASICDGRGADRVTEEIEGWQR